MPRAIHVLMAALALAAFARPAAADRLSEALADYRLGHYQEAGQMLEPLARAGNPEAQFWLGTMYYHGRGRPRIYREALAWFRRAAELGNPRAQNNLGLMYRNGDGVEPSPLVAYAWFALAAGQDSATARTNLDSVSDVMKPDQILQAQQLAEEYAVRVDAARRRAASAQAVAMAAPPPAPAPAAGSQRPPAPTAASAPHPGDDVYMVQVGLFQNADNVRRIADTVRAERLRLHNEVVQIRGSRYNRLRVGPYANATDARAVSQRLNTLLDLESAIVPVQRGG